MESPNPKTFRDEYITFNVENKKTQVKLSGTTKDPYFCGKDVCEMLGYENEIIKKIVEPENKKELKDLVKVVPFNEGKSIYVNERGLRSLINGSRTKMLFLNQVDQWLLDMSRRVMNESRRD